MTHTILVLGTASHVGKSTVAAGLCRLLADRGVDVAPFKAQNMSNNARVAVRTPVDGESPDGDPETDPEVAAERAEWGEIGVSQYVQSRAARRTPTVDANPVLLKPRGGGESQLVLRGEAVGHYASTAYYDQAFERARTVAADAHRRLAADADVIVAEGAGGAGEPNLRERDLANVETARFAADHGSVSALLLADIERGGAFAALVGTLALAPDVVVDAVAGTALSKFRGDPDLLAPAIEEVEVRTGVPSLGVLPHDDPGLPAEDSLSLPPEGESGVDGADDGVPGSRSVTVAVPRLPRAANVTDLDPLAATPGVRVAHRPPDALLDGGADAVVLPGSKNTVDDLLALRTAGVGDALRAFDGPIVGICGGYQMLGERIAGAALEGVGGYGDDETAVEGDDTAGTDADRDGDAGDPGPDGYRRSTDAGYLPDDDPAAADAAASVPGFGLLPVRTRFGPGKRVERVTRDLDGVGPLAGADGAATGYEIHAGETTVADGVARPVGPASAAVGNVLGTYLHGLFEAPAARRAFRAAACDAAGIDPPPLAAGDGDADGGAGSAGDAASAAVGDARDPYDAAAALVADNLDLTPLLAPAEVSLR